MARNGNERVLVIGGGPGGYAAAFRAAQHGLDVTVVDADGDLGGVCVDRGCIPSKALLTVMETILRARRVADAGVHFDEPEIDLDALRRWKDGVVDQLVAGLGKLADGREVERIQGRARFVDESTVEIDGDRQITFDHAILATGSRPRPLPDVDFDGPVMDSTAALALEEIPDSLLVVGGGYVGLELGQVYATLGSRVTLVEMTDSLLPGTDEDLVGPLAEAVEEQFAGVRLGEAVSSLEASDDGVRVRFAGGGSESDDEGSDDADDGSGQGEAEEFDRALVAIGRLPNTDDLGLDRAGIELGDEGHVRVDEQRRTTNEKVLALGDVAGGTLLAHEAMREGEVAADVLAGRRAAFDARAIPAVVYSDPQVAWCGLTEREAREEGREVEVARFPWQASGRALTLGATEGLTKLVFDPDSGRLLGAGIVGPQAEALIAEAVLAVEMGAVAGDLALSVHPHPTLSETLSEAAARFEGQALHLGDGPS